jgi:hypothetical protein
MNSISRWFHRADIKQELFLVQLWAFNILQAADPENDPQISELTAAAQAELKASVKYLSSEEIARAIAEVVAGTAYDREVRRKLRRHIQHRRAAGA